MDQLYHTLAHKLGWPLRQIDETDFETLMDFLFYKDPNTRVINGRTYNRAAGVPNWL
jgi:hypothetical protein